MIGFPSFDAKYFQKFSTKPVSILPFDKKSTVIAKEYIEKLITILDACDFDITHRGSTAFKISGKGDIELGIYPQENMWKRVIDKLTLYYKAAGCLEQNYARFNDNVEGYEIEVIVMRGLDAKIDRALTEYMIMNPEILRKYEELKKKYSFSKREYQIQKDKFFRTVVDQIPDQHH